MRVGLYFCPAWPSEAATRSSKSSTPARAPASTLQVRPEPPRACRVFFYFYIFQKKLQKYIFGFRFYSSVPLQPGRGLTARQRGGRDLYANKYKFFFAQKSLAGACRPPAGPAGSRPKYKTPPFLLRPHFLPTRSRRGERERGGVREVIPTTKPYRILDPNRRQQTDGSAPPTRIRRI